MCGVNDGGRKESEEGPLNDKHDHIGPLSIQVTPNTIARTRKHKKVGNYLT